MGVVRTGFAVLAAAVLAAGAATAADRPSDADLVRFFEAVVFQSEFKGVAASTYVKKWVAPLRVNVSNMTGRIVAKPDGGKEMKLTKKPPTKANVALIRKHLKTLVNLTGVTTEDAKKVKKPVNFQIKFVPRRAMAAPFLAKEAPPDLLKRMARSGVCYFLTWATKTGGILKAVIVVNNEMPGEKIDACLLEEMTQALGLPNDSDIMQPSVFNQRSVRRSLSRSDVILLKTLYHAQMAPGTPRDEALVAARHIIPQLNAAIP